MIHIWLSVADAFSFYTEIKLKKYVKQFMYLTVNMTIV